MGSLVCVRPFSVSPRLFSFHSTSSVQLCSFGPACINEACMQPCNWCLVPSPHSTVQKFIIIMAQDLQCPPIEGSHVAWRRVMFCLACSLITACPLAAPDSQPSSRLDTRDTPSFRGRGSASTPISRSVYPADERVQPQPRAHLQNKHIRYGA